MKTKIIKGDLIKDRIFDEVKNEIERLVSKHKKTPGIVFIGFSSPPLSKYNIPFHIHLAENAGFNVFKEILNDQTTEEEMFDLIEKFNDDEAVNSIVLLQPLPKHLNPIRIINKINPDKEIEGFHPQNMLSTLIPDIQTEKYPMCLPTGILELFKEAELEFKKDQEWVFVLDDEFISNTLTHMVVKSGASKIVPHDCSSTIINKSSKNLIDYCKKADILIIVSKETEYIEPAWLKKGVCIIDVYSNLVKEIPSKNDSSVLIPIIRGGVNVDSVENIASVILPIPGGLMTVVLPILLRNALTSFKNTLNLN
ncbi:tetrahydrofolate dehydrogenase/cyclohydrolase catalytic domain-containing protein [Flavobacterium sp.]|uniref:tetrahydrofolate dehydrogenase/cyclohydrolase catalytic domain-containing protein n=1 Tax=Flavobacterium sp. TaxID=239 RepID=UPI00261F8939|nr:tetrahydrofolate dehydrogenase/cyclohydrolase catalytic domain-containing protein [Flavobacterium sp.]